MSKCLRCGAGNEWIEPVAKEAKKPRRKRPKVRYVATGCTVTGEMGRYICSTDSHREPQVTMSRRAKRIAAALNHYEAVRRGEM